MLSCMKTLTCAQAAILGGLLLVNPAPMTAQGADHLQTFHASFSIDIIIWGLVVRYRYKYQEQFTEWMPLQKMCISKTVFSA